MNSKRVKRLKKAFNKIAKKLGLRTYVTPFNLHKNVVFNNSANAGRQCSHFEDSNPTKSLEERLYDAEEKVLAFAKLSKNIFLRFSKNFRESVAFSYGFLDAELESLEASYMSIEGDPCPN